MVVKCGKHEVEFITSIRKLPILEFQSFQKYLMIDNEVGSSFEDYDKRSVKMVELLRKQMYEEAIIEIDNRRQLVFNAFNEYQPKGYALALIVQRIDDVVYEEHDESTLVKIIERLNKIGFTKEMMDNTIDEVKKKSN